MNADNVIDKNKIRRARDKVRSQNTTKVASDNTLTSTLKDGRYYNRTIMKKHITIVGEPHSIFLSHVIADDGTSLTISNRLMEHLENKSIRTNSLSAIGSDGGVILRVETFLNRPLNWFICMLHLNELPFRHLFLKLDGSTTGPKSFTGVLGKKLKDCKKSDMVEFESISCEYFPNLDDYQNKLSQDQKYLYKMCRAIISGTCCVRLANLKPGPLNRLQSISTMLILSALWCHVLFSNLLISNQMMNMDGKRFKKSAALYIPWVSGQ